ncbi:MAG: four-helix bundle copper-binding protein [Methanocella sp.]
MQMLKQDKYQKAIELCYECAESCDADANADFNEKDIKKMVDCIKLDQDCAEVCIMTARYMSRDSVLSEAACAMCAEICDACAEECERHKNMEHCVKTASVCRAAANECRKTAQMA